MKKALRYVLFTFLLLGIIGSNSFAMAENDENVEKSTQYKGLTCIYRWSNYPVMLVQTPSGNILIRQLSQDYVDINDINSKYWTNPLSFLDKEIVYNQTKQFQNGKLEACPACLMVVDSVGEYFWNIFDKNRNKIVLIDEDSCNLKANEYDTSRSYHDLITSFDQAPVIFQENTGHVEIPDNVTCNILLGNPSTVGSPAFYLVKAFEVIRYVAVILLVVLTVIDYVGAVASQDKDILAKVTSKAIKRLVICVVIFLLPMLIKFILQFISNRQLDLCGVGE